MSGQVQFEGLYRWQSHTSCSERLLHTTTVNAAACLEVALLEAAQLTSIKGNPLFRGSSCDKHMNIDLFGPGLHG